MQTRFSYSILLAFAALFIFSSCNKSNKIGRYLPKNASMVVHLNGESVTSKLPWEEVKQNQLFQEIYSDTSLDAIVKSALDNPENTGIDTKSDLTFFVKQDSLGSYIAFQGKIKDAEKFKSFYTTATKGTVTAGKDGESILGNDKLNVIWNKDRFAIVSSGDHVNHLDMNKMNIPGMDSITQAAPKPVVNRDLAALSAMVFNLDENNSLAKDEKFSDLVKTKGDIHFWINAGEIAAQTPGMTSISMVNMTKLYEGSLITGTATFLEGKIDVDMKSYGGKEMTDFFKKYEGGKISSDMVKRIPAKDIAGLFAMNFKPQALPEFLKLIGMDGFANMGAGMLGFSLEDFVKANKGDIVLAVSDLTKDSVGKPEMSFLFSAAVNDKAAFNKLIDAGKKAGQGKFGASTTPGIFYNSNDKYFTISNKQASVNSFLGTESNNTFDFDKISGSPVGVFVNFQYLMRAMAPTSTDSLKMATYNASVQMWDNLIAKGGEFKDGGVVQHVEINLVDKKVNSLKQLNSYLGTMGAIEKIKKANRGNWTDSTRVMTDTTVAIVPAN